MQKPYNFAEATFSPFMNFKFSLKLILSYVLISILISVIFYGVLFATGLFQTALMDPTSGAYWIVNVLGIFIFWPLLASYMTAYYKRITMGYNGGLFPMRFGARELRVMLVQLVWFIIFVVFTILVTVIFAALAGVFGGSIGGGLSFILGLILIVAYLYLFARLAAASPLTVLRNKFSFFETFAATRGKGWWMVLSYFLQFLLFIAAYFLVALLLFAILGAAIGIGSLETLDEAAIMSMLTSPGLIISIILAYAIAILVISFLGLMFPGVGGYVAREHTGGSLDDITAVYD